MSGVPAYEFTLKRNGKLQEAVVNYGDQVFTFTFGAYVSAKRISELLPRLVMDNAKKSRRKGAK
ncbi:hypothetical protein Q0N12_16400 [Rossellomorea marisflavi]|uniref:hypothetical protein n=1 Tax=Rossellomorea marisflavi TaxID=189381 RepID=UPI00345A248F